MTSTASEYLSKVKWVEESFTPKDFASNTRLPQVGKIIRGQLPSEGLGVPTVTTPALNQIIFWTKVTTRTKVIAQCVKFKDYRGGSLPRAVTFGPRLEILEDYRGWFEILSEDGRSVRMIESVGELVKRFPREVLVRENIKAILGKKVANEEFLSDKSRVVMEGEVLSLETIGSFCPKNPSDKYLKCFTSTGETLFMRTDQKGKFSPIAREESISGVHSIPNLSVKRLPMMVRLVHGPWPSVSSFKSFQPTMRLLSVFEEEVLVGVPLLKDSSHLVYVPLTTANIRIVPPKNTSLLESLPQYKSLIQQASLATPVERTIQVIGSSLSSSPSATINCQSSFSQENIYEEIVTPIRYDPRGRLTSPSSILVKKEPQVNSDKGGNHQTIADCEVENSNCQKSEENKDSCCLSDSGSSSVDSAYEEIDQIYDYIRGFAPLPENVRKEIQSQQRQLMTDHRRLSYPTGVRDSSSPPALGLLSNNNSKKPVHPIIPSLVHQQHSNHLHHHRQLHHPSHPYVAAVAVHRRHPAVHHNLPTASHHHHPLYDRRPLRSNSLGRMMFPHPDPDGTGIHMRNFSSSQHNHHPLPHHPPPRVALHPNQRALLSSPSHPFQQGTREEGGGPAPLKTKLFVKKPSTAGLKSSSRGYHMLRYSSSAKHIPLPPPQDVYGSTVSPIPPSHLMPSSHIQNQPLPPPPPVEPVTTANCIVTGSTGARDNNGNISNSNTPHSGGSSGGSRSQVASPLFNIRYKSMTSVNNINNNHSSSPPLPVTYGYCQSSGKVAINSNGTLNSSDSSRQTSTSSTSKDLIIKDQVRSGGKKGRQLQLSKPKSLNNIFRELTSVLTSSPTTSDPMTGGREDEVSVSPDGNLSGGSSGGHFMMRDISNIRRHRSSHLHQTTTYSSNDSSICFSSGGNLNHLLNNNNNDSGGHRDDDKTCVNDIKKIDSRNASPSPAVKQLPSQPQSHHQHQEPKLGTVYL